MKKQKLFYKTVSILVKAYRENTLEHSNCYACAVGNIVAANCGYSLVKGDRLDVSYFTGLGTLTYDPPLLFIDQLTQCLIENSPKSLEVENQFKSTGYSWAQLQDIESAFESVSNKHNDEDRYMFDGLMAVVDCLMEIHEANTEEVKEAKELFVKA